MIDRVELTVPEVVGDAIRCALNPSCIPWDRLKQSEREWWVEMGQSVVEAISERRTVKAK